ncbi:phosphoglycolate phosphatase [Sulfuricella sp.]|uniref:phosphoglycolate phosphatase n=1 Tax=Sulfuricella sp. TaxID=2099377 RepID=UPI002CB1020A|nr:phosphoglycolate phosphatase [Sulfuricella sp.]HUX62594.1 phosphoglycolate phosphatase [Sulfuricella sp.]
MAASFPLPVKAVVIDLDGTLLNTAPDLAEAAQRMLRDLGMPPVSLEKIQSYIGNGIANLVKRALTGEIHGKPDEALFAKALPLFETHYDEVLHRETQPYPGVMEGLNALRDAGYTLVCITNKAQRFTLPLLAVMGMQNYFDLILSGDSLPRKKPDPLPLRYAAIYYEAEPKDLLLVGDSLNDSQAARAAGCPVVLLPYGYNGGKDVREQDCDAVIDSLPEVLKLIRKA